MANVKKNIGNAKISIVPIMFLYPTEPGKSHKKPVLPNFSREVPGPTPQIVSKRDSQYYFPLRDTTACLYLFTVLQLPTDIKQPMIVFITC